MSPEPRKVPEGSPQESLASLSGCLVDGDAEQRARERQVRRGALAISVLFEGAVLTLLVLVPLVVKTERIAAKEWIPIPPYGHVARHQRNNRKPLPPGPIDHRLRPSFPSAITRPVRELSEDADPLGPQDFLGDSAKDGAGCKGCVDIGGKDSGPRPPQPVMETPSKPAVIRMTRLDPAMLKHRVEPVYPPLAKQARISGTVRLSAIISTDGKNAQLHAMSGHPLLVNAAMDAVKRWAYSPTRLNGVPVEVITEITVTFTLN